MPDDPKRADRSRGVASVEGYRLDPDYTQPRLEIPEANRRRMLGRLSLLYGEERAERVYPELERRLQVHHRHKTAELLELEREVDPGERFSERDVLLITYGDSIAPTDSSSPLVALGRVVEEYFHGVITILHILPFFPYSSDRGFSVISYRQVDRRLGNWSDIADLDRSFRLMFDAVFNHISCQSRWFREFRAGHPDFQNHFTTFSSREEISEDHLRLILRPRTSDLLTVYETLGGPRWVWTTFSADQVDLNFKEPRVLLDVLDVLLYYVRRGADVIRLDAITYLWYELGTSCAHLEETHACVKLMRDVLDVAAPHVALVTETNVPHSDNVSYFGDGSDEAQMVYNFALPPLVLHTFHTGSCEALVGWADSLEYPSSSATYLNFLSSHDGIGLMGARGILTEEEIEAMCERVRQHGGFVSSRSDGAGGESPYELNITWYSALNREGSDEPRELQIDRFIASRAIALVLRGVPGIYLPSLFGSINDTEAVFRTQSKRDINRPTISERRLREMLLDPEADARRLADRFVELLKARTGHPAFHPSGDQKVLATDLSCFGLLRVAPDGGARVACLTNVTPDEQRVSLDAGELGVAGELRDLANGGGVTVRDGRLETKLPPYGVTWLASG